MRKLSLFLLAVALLASACMACVAEGPAQLLGQPFPDFTVQTVDGGTFTLSEALKDHDMVLVNFWATWCYYCELEFPFLEEAYGQYSDRVAVIALSGEPTDTDEVLGEYARSHGLTFPIGNGTDTGLVETYSYQGFPTSVVVDRFGNVAFIEVGAMDAAERFAALFEYFLRDDYTQTEVLNGLPPMRPNVERASEEALSAAGNAVGGTLALRNPEDGAVWPMLPDEDGGRKALVSTNAGSDSSRAAVCFDVNAAGGDVLAFDFRTSLEAVYDALFVEVDGEVVKRFTGEHDWTTWALPLSAGEHTVVMGCEKDAQSAEGEDRIWIGGIRLARGDEAAQLLAVLPESPAAEVFEVRLPGEGVREIAFEDSEGILTQVLGTETGWMVNGDQLTVDVALTAGSDPETAHVMYADGETHSIGEFLKDDGSGYAMPVPLSEGSYTAFAVFPSMERSLEAGKIFALFPDEAAVESIVKYLAAYGFEIGWHYADEGGAEAEAPAEDGNGAEAAYTVHVVDQNGDPVPGVSVTFCTDDRCELAEGGDDGTITYAGEPFAYHIQVVDWPEGYDFDDSQEIYTEAATSELTLEFVRE